MMIWSFLMSGSKITYEIKGSGSLHKASSLLYQTNIFSQFFSPPFVIMWDTEILYENGISDDRNHGNYDSNDDTDCNTQLKCIKLA